MIKTTEINIEKQVELHKVVAGYRFPDIEKMAAAFVLTKTPLAVGSADTATIELINPAFAELYGYTMDELLGKSISEIYAPEMRDSIFEDIDRINGLGYLIYESKHAKKDGTVFPVQIEATAIRDERKNLLFRIVSIHDITERKQTEERITNLVKELRRSNEDLEQFSGVLAHDLRGPLIAVAGAAHHLLKKYSDRLGDDGRDYIEMIRENARRMLRLISELREYAKSGCSLKELRDVDMDGIIRQATDNLRVDIVENKVNIKVDLMPIVKGDEVQLVQLAQNLISNAINYRKMNEPLNILISCERLESEWVFRLKDNGIGIERSLFDKIFVMFHRGAAERHEGMGLGLAICKKIVERHGGRIWVNAQPGKGTSFYFTLPIRE